MGRVDEDKYFEFIKRLTGTARSSKVNNTNFMRLSIRIMTACECEINASVQCSVESFLIDPLDIQITPCFDLVIRRKDHIITEKNFQLGGTNDFFLDRLNGKLT